MKVLTGEQMREVDRLTIEDGVPSIALMENAAHRVVEELMREFDPIDTTSSGYESCWRRILRNSAATRRKICDASPSWAFIPYSTFPRNCANVAK